MTRMLRLENPLESSEHGRLEHHSWHFAIPCYPMQHLVNVVIHFVGVFIKLLKQNQHGSDDFHVGESEAEYGS